jgi:hypothetical protein
VARQPLDPRRELEDALIGLVVAQGDAELVDLLAGLLDRHREGGARRDQLGELVGIAWRDLEGAGDVLHRGARLHRPEGDDLPDRVAPVPLAHVLDDLAAPLEAEVHVDVRHRDAFRIQEALEEEVELERADVGDPERVGDQRAGRRAAARPDRDAAVARRLDEVGGDQEVAGVPRLVDHAELVVEPFLHRRRQRRAVARLRTARRQVGSSASSVSYASGPRELRHEVALLEVELAEVRDPLRAIDRLGRSGKSARISASLFTYDSLPVKRKRFGSSRSAPVPIASRTSCASASARVR